MKLLIASDIHGDLDSIERVLGAFFENKCQRLLLLGDLLYHGPRNNLPSTYQPKAVIERLNEMRDYIIAVRGNCDTEVDQMVLNFPILQDQAMIFVDGLTILATHGHRYNLDNLPPLCKGDILLHGHTHVLKSVEFGDGNLYLNPGSCALPKENNPRTYMIYENRTFTTYTLEGDVVSSITV